MVKIIDESKHAPNNISRGSWATAFGQAKELNQFGSSRIGLFALALRFDIEDLTSVGTSSIVDGSDDKKNDIIFIDEEIGAAVIIQAHISRSKKSIAPSNKASDLNVAITWLIAMPLDDLPETIKSHARRLREGIKSGAIKKIYVWYVHNCTESLNVQVELDAVKSTLASTLKNNFKNQNLQQFVAEIGNSTLTEWYHESQSPIVVNDEITLDCPYGFTIGNEHWQAFVTAVAAEDLHSLYNQFSVKLFSANIRDYLGARSSQANINNGIQQSVRKSPENFWVFNNGITALTHEVEYDEKNKRLKISGLSIVNGAQTTGAIGSLENKPAATARVPIRFVRVGDKDQDLVQDIIRYNNSQNQVTAADFRSTDSFQKRLRSEVGKIKDAEYEGGRRGGFGSAIKRRPKLLPSFTVGQALAAFHGEPAIAYNKKSEVWNNDALYAQFFNEKTTGPHLVFVYALLKCIEAKKINLIERSKSTPGLTKGETLRLAYLRLPAAVFVYIYAIRNSLEAILQRPIHDYFALSFGYNTTPKSAMKAWDLIVDSTLPFTPQLTSSVSSGLSKASIDQGVQSFSQQVEVASSARDVEFQRFARQLRNPSSRSGASQALQKN